MRISGGWAWASASPVLAIDVGGTKLAAAVVEPGGRLVTWAQVPTPRDLDAEQLWRTLDALLGRGARGGRDLPRPPAWPASASGAAARWNGRPAWSRR